MVVVLMWVAVHTQVFTKEMGRALFTFTCSTIEELPRIVFCQIPYLCTHVEMDTHIHKYAHTHKHTPI